MHLFNIVNIVCVLLLWVLQAAAPALAIVMPRPLSRQKRKPNFELHGSSKDEYSFYQKRRMANASNAKKARDAAKKNAQDAVVQSALAKAREAKAASHHVASTQTSNVALA